VNKETQTDYKVELKRILRTEGFQGLYRGMAITLIKEFPGCGSFFYFKFLFDEILEVKEEQNYSKKVIKQILSGGLTGCFTWTIGMPLDVLKSVI